MDIMSKSALSLRTLALVASSAGAVALAGGCGSPSDSVYGSSTPAALPATVPAASAAAPSTAGSPAAAPPTATTTAATPAGTGAPTAPPAGAGAGATATTGAKEPARSIADPCPVTAPVLFTALKGDAAMSSVAKNATGLQTPSCSKGYAVAAVKHSGDFLAVVFSYDAVAAHWRPLNQGSGGYCTGFVPADIAKKLEGC